MDLIWPWHSVFGNGLNKTIPVVENPFSDPRYPREISLYLPAPAVVSFSRLRE